MKLLSIILFCLLVCQLQALGGFNSFERESSKAHNILRKRHGVKALKWSNAVAKHAGDWCKYLRDNDKFEHSQGSGYGENIFKSWGSSSDGAGRTAVQSWYDEIQDYDFKDLGFSYGTGHFTQVNLVVLDDKKVSKITILIIWAATKYG